MDLTSGTYQKTSFSDPRKIESDKMCRVLWLIEEVESL
jgi:hypothetical protein